MPPIAAAARAPVITGAKSVLGLAGFIVLCFSAAAFGSQFMPGDWYAALKKPSWNPPNWIFGPIWSALYTMMAVAAWLVWRQGGFMANALPLAAFLLQLVLNALWSWLFFGLRHPSLAFVEIIALWIAIALTLALFRQPSPLAAGLLAPYLAWVSFATLLNLTLWRLNAS